MSDHQLIAWIHSVAGVTRRWNHLTNDQKRRLLIAMQTMDALTSDAVIKTIGKIRRAR